MTRRRALAGALTLAAFAAAALPSRCALGVTRYELGYASLPAAFDGFRLVQLSDLHGARFGKGNSRLLAAVRAERPELIALTGDVLQTGSDSEVFAAASLCAALARIAPTYFVSGNHDVSCGALPRLASALAAAFGRRKNRRPPRRETAGFENREDSSSAQKHLSRMSGSRPLPMVALETTK